MRRPYPGGGNWHGRLNFPPDSIRQILREALHSNTQLMMHIVGDSTLDIVLRLMKEIAPGDIWKQKRVRLEHNATPMIRPWELDAIAEMGILVMHTPKYNQAGHIRSLLDHGVLVGISPDGTANPFVEIMLVCSGQENPAENISREQAVMAFTRTNAFAEFAEKEKGSLAKGMLADLAVLSQDIFTVPIAALPATRCELTIVDGKIVYSMTDNPPK
jgi:predicted amidohydrolase YtcJ